MALAGALALGVASVAKADDSMAVAAPVWNVLLQEQAVQHFATNLSPYGTNLIAGLENARLGGTFKAGADDTLTLEASFAAQNVTGFNLLNAYDVHSLNNFNTGLTLKIGQFKEAFGQDGYADPNQLIRVKYSLVDTLVPGTAGNFAANEGNAWKTGAELDQTYSDLTIQVAALDVNNSTTSTNFDYLGRVQWKGSNVALGLSDYFASTVNNQNTLGANGSVWVDAYKLDLEAIFGGNGQNGYTGTLSAKYGEIQPAVWYEWTTTSAGTNTGADDLGAGINWQVNANHRIALDVDFTGSNYGDILGVNTFTLQFQQTF